jgi:PKD repeat protein
MNKLTFFILLSIFVVSIHVPSQTIATAYPPINKKTVHPPPVPYFVIRGLCFGDTTHFINKTITTLISSEWNILNDKGDTLYHSKDKDLNYYFKKRGYYTICLTADNGHIATKTRMVRVDTLTKAAFAFRSCYDEFDNQSTCSDQFVWVLPDKSTSTAIDPAYVFSAPGKYAVTLISKKGNSADTLHKLISIKGDSVGIPTATFTCKRLSADSTFEFTALDSLADIYSWYFGDGLGDDTSGYKAIHKINSTYSPPVNLFITNGCGVAVDLLDPFAVTDITEEINNASFSLTIFPNPPEADELTVSINKLTPGKHVCIRLMDVRGALLKESTFLNAAETINFKYDTHIFSTGIYLLQVKAGEEMVNRKFIVK